MLQAQARPRHVEVGEDILRVDMRFLQEDYVHVYTCIYIYLPQSLCKPLFPLSEKGRRICSLKKVAVVKLIGADWVVYQDLADLVGSRECGKGVSGPRGWDGLRNGIQGSELRGSKK